MGSPASNSIYADQRVFRELATHPLYQVREDQAACIYDVQKVFWSSRDLDADYLNKILESYSQAMEKPYLAPVAARLRHLAKEIPEGKPVRVLELGGANAAFLHWWRAHMKGTPLSYTGIEPYKPFVDHVNARFPEAGMIQGDAETFVGMDFEGRPPFTAFVAATVFCMIHPDVVRRCLLKAATLTDDFLIRDFVINIQGGLLPEGYLVFDFYGRPDMPLMFAHHYEKFFKEIGFKVVHIEETRTESDGPGWGLVHVKRAPA